MRENGDHQCDRISARVRLCWLPRMIGCLLLFAGGVVSGSGEASRDVRGLYLQYCASCHGAGMDGGNGGSLLTGVWKHGSTDEEIARVISDGLPDEGMPGYSEQLSSDEIMAMVSLIRKAAMLSPEMRVTLSERNSGAEVIRSGEYLFRLETLLEPLK